MKRLSCLFLSILCIGMSVNVSAEQVVLESSTGGTYLIEISPEESFSAVLDTIKDYVVVAEYQDFERVNPDQFVVKSDVGNFHMSVANNSISVKSAAKKVSNGRNYYQPLTNQDKSDITYIVTTLANSSLLGLGVAKSSLETAGDRLDPVHPLQFLTYVFTNEELKTSMKSLQGNSWIWKKFISGINESLDEEYKCNNMSYAQNFASAVGIDVNLILPSLNSAKWEQFISLLIKNVPRKAVPNRYDM